MNSTEAELLARVGEIHGFVPNQHELDAHLPLLLRSLLDLNRRVLLAGDLDPGFLERLALVLSVENECPYCMAYHEMVLENRDVAPEEVAALEADWRDVGLSPREEALMAFALDVNADPHAVTDADVQALLERDVTEKDLVQLVHFVTLIRGYNTFNVVFDTDLDNADGGWTE